MAKEYKESSCCSPHILMVPCPAQGHIIPMFKLAKLLHHQGFHITFLNTDFNHQRLLRSHGVSSLEGLIPNFEFVSIPDGLPVSDENATQDPVAIMHAIRTTLVDPFKDFVSGSLSKTNGASSTWIVTDAFNSFAIEVAQHFSIPTVQFVIHGACPFLSMASFKDLTHNGLIPLKDGACYTNGYLDTTVNCVPGLEGIQLKYLSSWILTTDVNHPAVEVMTSVCETSINASSSAILINSFEELEFSAINQLSALYSTKFLPIGPIHLLENRVLDDGFNSFEVNLWKEDSSCIEWLDSKPSGSVLFVSFGSMARLTAQEMTELAWGLANSKQYFMWVIRPDLVKGEDGSGCATLPEDFDVEIKGRGFLTSWCPQEKVLGHPAIGGFLTQCGWNSLLESLCAGVPVICWPNWAEQVTNGWCCSHEWRMGIELDTNNIGRNEIERVVKEMMNGNKGKEIKKNAIDWKNKAEDACTIGSSRTRFDELVRLLRS